MATFLALIEGLIGDPAEKAAYAADPDNYLSAHGFGELDPEDVSTALAHTADAFPPRLAAVIDPDAGLAPVAEVDMGQLGLSSFDDYAPPLDDERGGVDEVADDGATGALPDGGATHHSGLDRDVDIDLDGDGIPDAPAPAVTADGSPASSGAPAGDRADADGDERAVDVSDGDELAAPAVGTAADPFSDPWSDPGIGVDDEAPWMEQRPDGTDFETVDEPADDILDDVDEDLGQ